MFTAFKPFVPAVVSVLQNNEQDGRC